VDQPESLGDTELGRLEHLTSRIIGAAIEVHRALGPGLLEPLYERALCIELDACQMRYLRQTPVPAYYRGHPLGQYRVDLVVEDAIVVEVKSVIHMPSVLEAQVMTYLRLTGMRVGLLINFNSRLLKHGIRRFVL
jgi:GxxExxY protein